MNCENDFGETFIECYDWDKWFWEKPCQNTVANGSRR